MPGDYIGALVETLFWGKAVCSMSPVWTVAEEYVGNPPQDKEAKEKSRISVGR